ncbi:MAG: hypothetical protein HQ541_19470 [Mariniphaga sp.]|nr:hypothetical protein [Mariniphaga sp.]
MNNDVIATFSLDGGKKYEVIECNYGFSQNYDSSNKPTATASINIINLAIKVTEDIELVDWMITKLAAKKGEIVIKLTESKFRKIIFTHGYCVNYNERFDNYSGTSFLLNIDILVKDIEIEGNGSVSHNSDLENRS